MSTPLIIAQLMLGLLGLVGVATAQPDLVPKHAAMTLLGLAATVAASRLQIPQLARAARPLFWATIGLLALTLVIGKGGNGSDVKRWIDLGPIAFQPSEFAKLSLIVMLATFFGERGADGSFFGGRGRQSKLLGAIVMIGLTSLLVVLEPDLGTTVLIFGSGLVMLYVAGIRITSIGALLVLVASLMIPAASVYMETHPYVKARYEGFKAGKLGTDENHAQTDGYQVAQAQKAMKRGGLWGHGPDGGLPHLPAGHTDMIVASVAFAGGLLGVGLIFLSYWVVVACGLRAAELAGGEHFSPARHAAGVMAGGATFMIAGQAMINLAVNVGIFPVTGVPLPMVSFGGSGQLATGLAFALIHIALREARTLRGPAVAAALA